MGTVRPVWLCDPEKNTECPKKHCAWLHELGECRHTHKKECAKDGAEPEFWPSEGPTVTDRN